MPLVFVHGVNNRRGTTGAEQKVFDNYMAFLREQFAATAFADRVTAPDGLQAFTPYWGNLGVDFARNLACIPHEGIQALAVGQPELAPLLQTTAARLDADTLGKPQMRSAPLLTLAKTRDLVAAVDLLFAGAALAPVPAIVLDPAGLREAQQDAARLARAAESYAAANPHPAWLGEINDDKALVKRIVQEAKTAAPAAGANSPGTTSVQTLGLGSKVGTWLENAANAVRDSVNRVADTAAEAVESATTQGARKGFLLFSGSIRPKASAFVGRFLGDIFTYMENRQPIVDLILADIDKAVAAKRPGDDELYLVGHSFGGIVLYDILSSFRADLDCALLVTVGSQVALFAEMGRLMDNQNIATQLAASATSVAARPQAAQRWINIFDPTDFVGFGTKGVFGGALDFQFETDAMPIVSHSAYFETPRFFGRLRERVAEAFAHGTDA
jgi:hypothetical protein